MLQRGDVVRWEKLGKVKLPSSENASECGQTERLMSVNPAADMSHARHDDVVVAVFFFFKL